MRQGWTPRLLLGSYLDGLLAIREARWHDLVSDDGTVSYGAADELEAARALLDATSEGDRSGWSLEDLVTRDHLRALVAEIGHRP